MNEHPAPQLSRDQLGDMSVDDILTAKEVGQLDALLGRQPRIDVDKPHLDRDDLKRMSAKQIIEARAAGKLDHFGIYPQRAR